MTATIGLAICVGIFFASLAAMIAVDIYMQTRDAAADVDHLTEADLEQDEVDMRFDDVTRGEE